MKKILFIIIGLFLLFSSPVYAVTAWVDDTGEVEVWANCQGAAKEGAAACTMATALANAVGDDIVNFRTGSYSTTLLPANSGTSGHQITFTSYGEEVATLTSSDCINLKDRSYITINGFVANNVERFIETGEQGSTGGNSHYNIISNNVITNDYDHETGWGVISLYDNCTYWQITGNSLSVSHGSAVQLYDECDYNRIEGNTFADSHEHDSVMIRTDSNYNVVRGNTFINTGLLAQAVGTDTMIMINYYSTHNLIENNIFYEEGSNYNDGRCAALKIHNGSYNIIRKNTVYNMDKFGFELYTNSMGTPADNAYNTIYNNTMYNVDVNTDQTDEAAIILYYFSAADIHDNCIVNNIIHTCKKYGLEEIGVGGVSNIYDNVYRNNNLYDITLDDVKVAPDKYTYTEANALDNFSGNMAVDSDFTNTGSADFTLKSTSSLIDAGTYLTEAYGAAAGGSSDQLTVDFAGYFYAGNAIGSTADYIYIVGDGDPANVLVQISSISGNVITLASAQNWEDNADIYLAYSSTVGFFGTAPDLGANEYSLEVYNVSPTDGGTGISITSSATWDYVATVDDAEVWVDEGACDGTPDDAGADGLGDESSADADKTYDMSTLLENTAYCLTLVANDGSLQGAFQQFDFTTTEGPPAPPAGLAVGVCHSLGMTGVYDDQGVTVGE